LALPFILLFAFTAEMARGLRFAFRQARLEMRLNLSEYRHVMQQHNTNNDTAGQP
jgi:hypothetical protein